MSANGSKKMWMALTGGGEKWENVGNRGDPSTGNLLASCIALVYSSFSIICQ